MRFPSWVLAGWVGGHERAAWGMTSPPPLPHVAGGTRCIWKGSGEGQSAGERELGCAGAPDCSGLLLQSEHFTQQIVVI